jgi:hypothetical protein
MHRLEVLWGGDSINDEVMCAWIMEPQYPGKTDEVPTWSINMQNAMNYQQHASKNPPSVTPLMFGNNGEAIASTNYWDSDQAQDGCCFLSWNAGTGRLLVPDVLVSAIAEMRTAKYVIVSRGPWRTHGGRTAIELLFEDGSNSPFVLTITEQQTDRLLPKSDEKGKFDVVIWSRDGEQLRRPGHYRIVKSIPCLRPL